MGRLHENLRMENQLIVDLIYTLLVKVQCACNPHLGFQLSYFPSLMQFSV